VNKSSVVFISYISILPSAEEETEAGACGGEPPLFKSGCGGKFSLNNTRNAFLNRKFGLQMFIFAQYSLIQNQIQSLNG